MQTVLYMSCHIRLQIACSGYSISFTLGVLYLAISVAVECWWLFLYLRWELYTTAGETRGSRRLLLSYESGYISGDLAAYLCWMCSSKSLPFEVRAAKVVHICKADLTHHVHLISRTLCILVSSLKPKCAKMSALKTLCAFLITFC